eukprot:1857932-Rhodomonas_salina.1
MTHLAREQLLPARRCSGVRAAIIIRDDPARLGPASPTHLEPEVARPELLTFDASSSKDVRLMNAEATLSGGSDILWL